MNNKVLFKTTHIWYYVILTYLITWSCWVPLIYNNKSETLTLNNPDNAVLLLLGTFGPTISAILIYLFFKVPQITFEWLKQSFNFKIGVKRFFGLFFSITWLLPLMVYIYNSIVTTQNMEWWKIFITMVLLMPINFIFTLLGGPIGEELGWRGFLTPQLLSRYTRIETAIITGLIWAGWHIPLFRFVEYQKAGIDTYLNFVLYTIQGILLSYLLIKVLTKSRFSIILVIVFHSVFNMVAQFSSIDVYFAPLTINPLFNSFLELLVLVLYILIMEMIMDRFKSSTRIY